MLRRLIEGALLIVLAWFLVEQFDAGQTVLWLGIAAVIAFTFWRIRSLWRKYQRLRHELATGAANLSDDSKEEDGAERTFRRPRVTDAGDMTISTTSLLLRDFVLGGATGDYTPIEQGGGMGGGDGAGVDTGGGGGVGGGVDMGGGGGG